MHNRVISCEVCGNMSSRHILISKQIGGVFKRIWVCPSCHEQHKRELEMTRENFRRQFGDN